MHFRPCIDIHNGKVKQIVGGSLRDEGDFARENFVSDQDALFYAQLYGKEGLRGGHMILLNPPGSPFYEATKKQAFTALQAAPGLWQVGGGIRPENAESFLQAGALQVIVTSYVFQDGQINMQNLERMKSSVGREHLVLDVSCRLRDGQYRIVTDRWQKFTDVCLNLQVLNELSAFCSEFLVHAVDVEGQASGPQWELVRLLGDFDLLPVTYAGGIGSMEDLTRIREEGQNRVDVTVGSALDLFGGPLPYKKVVAFCEKFTEN